MGCLLMLSGIICQLWAATNVSDIPLSTLCETYSGSGETMGLDDFNALFDWYSDSHFKYSKDAATFNRVYCAGSKAFSAQRVQAVHV